MGIPSYYKKLIDTIPYLVRKNHPDESVSWLFMDFNCLIYHCLHRCDTPPYPGDEGKDAWEYSFIDCIIQYCIKVIKEVSPKNGVFIAIDGVVPMAKMRQQRLRRFKSVWLTQNTVEDSNSTNGPVWDRNSITPGTLFMKKLRNGLEKMISAHGKNKWILSSSDEPGEGEHKIISEWRSGKYADNFAVYGLDADLIVLSILGRECCNLNNKIWLFREEVNAGKITYDDKGEEVFEWFYINSLKDWLGGECTSKEKEFTLNYCFAMSVLGNDFLPSSLGLKIRDDGHAELLDIIRVMTNNGCHLINPDTLDIAPDGVIQLFNTLSTDEESRIRKYISKKQMFAQNLDRAVIKIGDNNWPLAQFEEAVLVEGKQLRPNWKESYISHFFNGYSLNTTDISRICREYLYGIQWIWAYYTGSENVCFNWVYPFNLPPLWQWISEYLKMQSGLPAFPEKILIRAGDIKPVEQLAIVLPLESWSLIPPCLERNLPKLAPQFYPDKFTFESIGKRFFWECESLIPVPSIIEIKTIIQGARSIFA